MKQCAENQFQLEPGRTACDDCHSTCASCVPGQASNCTSCASAPHKLYLDPNKNTCNADCPYGYEKNNTDKANRVCVAIVDKEPPSGPFGLLIPTDNLTAAAKESPSNPRKPQTPSYTWQIKPESPRVPHQFPTHHAANSPTQECPGLAPVEIAGMSLTTRRRGSLRVPPRPTAAQIPFIVEYGLQQFLPSWTTMVNECGLKV